MTNEDTGPAALRETYLRYLECLNRQAWSELGEFVRDDAVHNGRAFGLKGYCEMLIKDYEDIPDLYFSASLVVCEPPMIAARLEFRCSPRGVFLGLLVNGRTISFAEHVTYEFEGSKIVKVWSILDKSVVELQIAG
ncbi:ester cyclase [Neorhizobium sp. T25_27]|uniref:ester cyclase n=1 Tax=Neorhizobium sp. T25_27 TaxID=2093831 RepID=UPI000CF9DA3B|nr:ester cyclase [Neorhizobium sp. T25_27]